MAVRILDRVRDGDDYPYSVVSRALVLTGDLDEFRQTWVVVAQQHQEQRTEEGMQQV
jgi:hypothetical protein